MIWWEYDGGHTKEVDSVYLYLTTMAVWYLPTITDKNPYFVKFVGCHACEPPGLMKSMYISKCGATNFHMSPYFSPNRQYIQSCNHTYTNRVKTNYLITIWFKEAGWRIYASVNLVSWLVVCLAATHYLTQCCMVINWIMGKKCQ